MLDCERGAVCDWHLAWLPDQATVQATLANLPLDAVAAAFPVGDPRRAQYEQWAEDALVTAVFCILLCATFGTLAIRYFAPLLLVRVRPPLCSAPEAGCPMCACTLHACVCKDRICIYPSKSDSGACKTREPSAGRHVLYILPWKCP